MSAEELSTASASPEEWLGRIQPALDSLRRGIAHACRAAGRVDSEVRLVAVSKTKPVEAVAAALQLGLSDFGENYAQELRNKDAVLRVGRSDDTARALPCWHFIGPLQRNKVSLVVGRAVLIHSIDSVSLVIALGDRVERLRQLAKEPGHAELTQDCLVQVNVGNEAQKSGCQPEDLPAILDAIAEQAGRLRCRGLMCIPPAVTDENLEAVRPYFARLRALRDAQQQVQRPHVALVELSMGMSHDYEVAIAEGATLIRVGTALFGAR